MQFVDLHTHLLPGVDDGSASVDETIRCLADFAASGAGDVVATPHFVLYPEIGGDGGLRARLARLREAFEDVRIAVAAASPIARLHFGQEIFAPSVSYIRPLVDVPEIGLAGTRFLLVEFGFELGDGHGEVIEMARAAGRDVIVAHPERYRYPRFTDPLDTVRRWRDLGAFLQVNLGSLLGYYNGWSDAETLAWRLLDEGLVHFLASDDHGDHRPQRHHRAVLAKLTGRGAADQAEQLLAVNPSRVLRGEAPQDLAPLPAVEIEAA